MAAGEALSYIHGNPQMARGVDISEKEFQKGEIEHL